MQRNRPALFKGRHLKPRSSFCVSAGIFGLDAAPGNLEQIMAERNLNVDHVTIWRWVQRCAPELNRRCRLEMRMRNRAWTKHTFASRASGPIYTEQWIPPV